MDLMEYKAKELFIRFGLPAAAGYTFENAEALEAQSGSFEYPAVLKSQVAAGGRGKAGGILFAGTPDEAALAARRLFGLEIKGHTVKKVMVTKKAGIRRELYLSILLDRDEKKPALIFSGEGGVDIERTAKEHPDRITKILLDPALGIRDYTARYLGDKAGLSGAQTEQLYLLLKNLFRLFMEYGCLLCEINPLAVTEEGSLLALDGKISVDDSGLKRLPDLLEYEKNMEKPALVREAESFRFLYIPCEARGDIAVMSNGSGMIMSCIDLIAKSGMSVRASLDMGGGATADRIGEAVRLILSDERTRLLFINIFGGITRCDEVAGGISQAVSEYGIEKPVIVRFEGTNKEKGLEILRGIPNVTYVPGLAEGVEAILRHKTGGAEGKAGAGN